MTSSVKESRLEEIWPFLEERLAAGQSVSFSPRGTSMRPMLRQGVDTVELISVSGPLKKYDLALYRRASGQFVLHRIVKADEAYTCIGDNQFEYEYPVKPEQVLAVACSFTRGGRRIPVTSFTYRLYCCLWCSTRTIRLYYRYGMERLKRMLKLTMK